MERATHCQYQGSCQEWSSPQGVPDRVVSVEAGGIQRTFFVFVENCGTTRSPDSAGNSRHQATVGGEAAERQYHQNEGTEYSYRSQEMVGGGLLRA